MQKIFNVSVNFSGVTVYNSSIEDVVHFEISKTDQFGRSLDSIQDLHGTGIVEDSTYHNSLSIRTSRGNGPRLARLLGWPGEITVVDSFSGERWKVEAWDFNCVQKEGEV